MSDKIEPRLLKGFRDYSLEEETKRQAVFQKIRTIFQEFGFLPLATPILEYKEVLMGKYGDDEKLVYSFLDNGGRDVAIRYDLTVPLARYVAQNQGSLLFPFKRYQIAPVCRADNPQKGRFREFYQCDVDVVGSDSVISDAEVIACAALGLEAVGVVNYKIRISDRAVLAPFSKDAVRIIDKVDKIGVDGMVAEMRSRGITEVEIIQAKALVEGQKTAMPERLSKVIDCLKQFNLKGTVEFDPTIARGLDYYSGTVFETVLVDKPEYGSICSGGRYDGLLDQFSNQGLPAVGASIGVDRLFSALEELGLLSQKSPIDVLIVNLSEELAPEYIDLASKLRESSINAELYYEALKLDKQFKYAERKNIPWAVVMGEDEVKTGKLKLKNLLTREQEELGIADVVAKLLKTKSII